MNDSSPLERCLLIVDDDQDVLDLFGMFLDGIPGEILTAEDGATACQLIEAEKPALVVLDLGLPDADGVEILRWMRSVEHLTSIPVLVTTASHMREAECLEAGANAFATKPIGMADFVSKVVTLLST